MKDWEIAARKFIDECEFKDDIDAVFLTGSYATGNADEFSDIDLYIVLNDAVNYRQRGNRRVDGFLVEYFANPMRQIRKYIDTNHENVRTTEVNMILGGRLIFSKNSTANELIDYCQQKTTTPFAKMSEFHIKTGLYHFWNNYDELSRAHAYQAPDFAIQFYHFIQNAMELYSRYTCSPIPSYHNLHRWITDAEYFAKYGLPAHNDPDFLEIIRKSYNCVDTDAMLDLSKELYAYVTNKMGGFDIDNFTLHSPCD